MLKNLLNPFRSKPEVTPESPSNGPGAQPAPGANPSAPSNGPPAPTPAEQLLAQAYQARDTAQSRLTESNALLLAANARVTDLTARNESGALALDKANTDLAAANALVASLTTERDALKTANAQTREEIRKDVVSKELATLAAAQGIELKDVPGQDAADGTGRPATPANVTGVSRLAACIKLPG
jgi:hypothetical protein